MKKVLYVALAVLIASACAKPEYPDFFTPGNEAFTHDNVEISAMSLTSTGMAFQSSLEAKIDHDAGTILFVVPRVERLKYDLTKVKLSATVYYDAEITPKLSNKIWDVTSDDEGNPRITLTVKSKMTGKTKTYTVRGYVSSGS